MRTTPAKIVFLALIPLIAAALYACTRTASMPALHPVEVESAPVCGDCHADDRAALNHTEDFFTVKHRYYAEQQSRTCTLCHKESFCSDCHAHREELKPSDKYKNFPERALPHRGDYLNQHKIDGRINHAACMKCHGRTNNERCRTCHR
jgi:hypothetical protein